MIFFPDQYTKVREGFLSSYFEDLIYGRIQDVLDTYYRTLYEEV